MYRQVATGPSSVLSDAFQKFTLRRYQNLAVAALLLLLLSSAVWFYQDIAIIGNPYVARINERPSSTSQGHQQLAAGSTGSEWETQKPLTETGHLIPPKIWQILLPKGQSGDDEHPSPEILQDTASWLALNPDYIYTLVGHEGGTKFVETFFSNKPKVVDLWHRLPNVGMKSDLLRYLILDIEGGVYTDTDTVALKSINQWVPDELRDKVRLIVGIEFDRRDGGGWADIPHWLQFCQWTIAATPGHPVFPSMVDRIIQSVDELTEAHGGVPLDRLAATSFDVMNSTGPAAWTDVVFAQLQRHDPRLNTTQDLSFMEEPALYGDILVLTIDGFGMGQDHSHSTNDGSTPEAALMKHLFRGSWRPDEADGDEEEEQERAEESED